MANALNGKETGIRTRIYLHINGPFIKKYKNKWHEKLAEYNNDNDNDSKEDNKLITMEIIKKPHY